MVKLKRSPKNLELDINVAKMCNSMFFNTSKFFNGQFRSVAWKSVCRGYCWTWQWVRSSSAKRKVLDKMLRPKFGLRLNLRMNLTSRQRLGLRIFLDGILVLDFCVNRDLSPRKLLRPKLSWTRQQLAGNSQW